MNKLRKNPIFICVLIIGLLSSVFIVSKRIVLEYNDKHVAGAMEYSDILDFSIKGGYTIDDWLLTLKNANMEYLIVSNETALEAEPYIKKYNLKSAWLDSGKPFPKNITKPSIIIPDEKSNYSQKDIKTDVPFGLIENNFRTGLALPKQLNDIKPDKLLEKGVVPAKVLYLYKGYRHMWTDEKKGDEIQALIFRAITDRSARFIWLKGMTDKTFEVATFNPKDYSAIFEKLQTRLEKRGLAFGNGFSTRVPQKISNILLGLAGFTSVALTAIFITMLLNKQISVKIYNIFLLFGCLFCIISCYILPISLYQILASVYTAILIPCIMGIYLRNLYFYESCTNDFLRYSCYSFSFLIFSMFGGILVSSFLSTSSYLLEFNVFSGVKFSQFIPLAFTIALFIIIAIKSPKQNYNNKFIKFLPIISTVIIIGSVVIIMLVRSGDVKSTPKIEDFIRDFLENTLYTRPRTKEFACVWPSIAVFLWSQKRKLSFLSIPFGIISVITAISIVNTFCHIYTVLKVSIIRTLLGFIIGFIIGIIAIIVLNLLEKAFKKFIYPRLNV